MKKGSMADVFLGDVINAQKSYFNKQMILSAVFFHFIKIMQPYSFRDCFIIPSNYIIKVNMRNITKAYQICSKLIIKI